MQLRIGRRLTVALLGSTLTLLTAVPAMAATPATVGADASVTVGQLVLAPTDRGYQGSLPITVANEGDTSTYFNVSITEPVAGSIATLVPESPCTFGYTPDNRRIYHCPVPGPDLVPGEQRSFHMTFQALVTPRSYAMVASGGVVTVAPGGGHPVTDQSNFTTLFRSTSGSLRKPQPYVQDTMADASITTAGQLTLIRQSDGRFAGRLPATVNYGGDAGHDFLAVRVIGLPNGFQVTGTDPQEEPSFFTQFQVPGPKFMPGEVRGFDVLFEAPADAPVGNLGSVSFELSTRWDGNPVVDSSPADNAVSFTLSTVEAS